ncbi:MAG: DNRLRE domain-containing protein [Bacteroidetes bacterium]|nr:DNRLRE domain-containing protein [Bacteroidota bacterium]MBL6944946.1 DNRLRE domain-containing protein [Bacteroidales bacterium]
MKKQALFVVIFIITFSCGNSFAQTTVTCPVTADTYISELMPNTNFGTDPSIVVGEGNSGESIASLIKFDLSSIPSNALITSAYLTLTYGFPQSTVNGRIYNIISSWNEYTITFNSGVNFGNDYYSFTTGSGSYLSIQVETLVANWIENSMTNWGFFLIPVSSPNGNMCAFYSREAYSGAYEPELEVTYTLPLPNLTYDANNCNLDVNGTIVDIEVRVINNGLSNAGSNTLAYYLSLDNIITTNDWKIGEDAVYSLAPGGYSDESLYVDVTTVTPTIPPGTYKVGFIIDYLDEVDESNENDNWACWTSDPVVIPDNCTVSVPSGTTVSSNSGTQNISVTSNGVSTWTASETCYWVSISPTSGIGNGNVTATYQANTSSNSRSCTITFTCDNSTDTYVLEQLGNSDCTVSVPSGNTVSYSSGTKNIPVTSNGNGWWTASETCYWVSISPTSGIGNGNVTATYQANTSSNSRSCTITFTCDNSTDTYTLSQSPGPTGVNEIDYIYHLRIYPNPNAGIFTLEMEIKKHKKIEIRLINTMGQVIYSNNTGSIFGKYSTIIDISGMPKGIYLFELITQEGIIRNKIIKN